MNFSSQTSQNPTLGLDPFLSLPCFITLFEEVISKVFKKVFFQDFLQIFLSILLTLGRYLRKLHQINSCWHTSYQVVTISGSRIICLDLEKINHITAFLLL